ncbi:ABC transporter permease [filamentous cyanobacterium LEGE 11480]|uniref:ABC transporter permease n=1 Tax=Romeriopsis navalis LEGE 11480 TaxID=2777977 RepID=A0A928Z599_9CYAN|nr:ABC transporter permease [Romeriopsis navalis]MBE9032599.1 ABC transporter permease [Romeriopsis navalis LEGE 11480]
MEWWERLKRNRLAKLGAIVLICLYVTVIFAGFTAPYDPYASQPDGALLPPTRIHWINQQDQRWIGPHVYPTTQGKIDLETGKQELRVDLTQPSPIQFFAKTDNGKFHLFGTAGPGKFNLLGTDEQARDQLSRLIHGGRISLSIGILGIAIMFPLGLLIGGISGYFGGWLDTGIMRMVEVIMTIPSIYLLIALAAVLPAGLSSTQRFALVVMITSFVGWAGLARVIRGQVLSIKEREYVQAAKVMGAKPLYIITRHILPQTATYVIISATLAIPSFIIAESVLSLIGLGIQQPDPSWGNMLSLATNASVLVLQPWLVWAPATLIVLTVLCFNLLGDGLRDALDPRNFDQ